MKYGTISVSPLELTLDLDNPRFFRARQCKDQAQVRLYMLSHEDILGLARSIVGQGGLYPGERIIVTKENGKFVVLEGNRRVTACQMLLDPQLVPAGWPMPRATAQLRETISAMEADLVEARQSAAATLAARHLEAIRKWGPLAKMRYFADAFEAGLSTKDINARTAIKTGDVEAAIKDYYLLMYALNLPCWTEDERTTKLDIGNIKITRYLRVFHTKDSSDHIGLSYDPHSLQPVSSLPKKLFDAVIEEVMRETVVDGNANTRTTSILRVGKVATLLGKTTGDEPPGTTSSPTSDTDMSSTTARNDKQGPSVAHVEGSAFGTAQQSESQPPRKAVSSAPPRRLFFENFAYGALNEGDAQARGVLAIAREIEAISTEAYLRKFPNAAGMLLRTLIDQALRYFLRRRGQWHRLENKYNGDPTLGQVIDCCRKWDDIFGTSDLRRLFGVLFPDDSAKDKLDMIIHHPDLSKMTVTWLSERANEGMLPFVEFLVSDAEPRRGQSH